MAARFVTFVVSLMWIVVSRSKISVRADGCSTDPLVLVNGSYFVSDVAVLPSTVDVGGAISACCDKGFQIQGPATLTCLTTGNFSDERPTCADIDECTAPWLPSASDEIFSSSYSNPEDAPVAFDPLLDGDQETCQGTGLLPPNAERCNLWDADCHNTEGSFTCECREPYVGDGINCELDTSPCVALLAPDHGSFRYQFERRVAFRCDEGFTLYGCEEQTCRTGRWVNNFPGNHEECAPPRCIDNSVRCDVHVALSHGRLWGRERTVGSSVYFICDDDYQLVGSAERICLGTGTWSGWTPRCKPKETIYDGLQRNMIDKFTAFTNSSQMRMNMARSVNVESVGLDLVLAYDRSSSIQPNDFDLAVNFTKQLITKFGVSYDAGGTRVAAVTFANDAEIAFTFSPEVDTLEKVFEGIDELKNGPRGGTALKEALEAIAVTIEPAMRPAAKHVLFIFTDGQHNTEDPIVLANDLKTKGVEIFAVGVGSFINQTALQRIASSPAATHFFYIRDFEELRKLTQIVSRSNATDYSLCGQAGVVTSGADLAANGHRASEKAWPWLSIIHRSTPDGKEMLCSGALLCRQWVLTTASCFERDPYAVLDMELYDFESADLITLTVTVGEHDTSREVGCEQTIAADDIILHDSFSTDSSDYDIALLHLTEPVDLNSCARTVCLPTDIYSPGDCYVAGWGTANHANPDSQASPVPIQSPMPLANCRPEDTCPYAQGGGVPPPCRRSDVSERMACAGNRLSQDDHCRGDPGSPLVCQSDEETWVVHGVSTTFGDGCSKYNRYGVFSKIAKYVEWIKSHTENCTAQHIPENVSFQN